MELRSPGSPIIKCVEIVISLKSSYLYSQVWNSTNWTLNEGPQGLERLDYVIKTAGTYGIKVILAFTNNW